MLKITWKLFSIMIAMAVFCVEQTLVKKYDNRPSVQVS